MGGERWRGNEGELTSSGANFGRGAWGSGVLVLEEGSVRFLQHEVPAPSLACRHIHHSRRCRAHHQDAPDGPALRLTYAPEEGRATKVNSDTQCLVCAPEEAASALTVVWVPPTAYRAACVQTDSARNDARAAGPRKATPETRLSLVASGPPRGSGTGTGRRDAAGIGNGIGAERRCSAGLASVSGCAAPCLPGHRPG